MPLQSSGEISIADVITFTRASSSVINPFSIGPANTQRSLSFYYNQAFVIPSTFDGTYNPNSDSFVLTTITTTPTGSSIFPSIGSIFSIQLNNSGGYFGSPTVNTSKIHEFNITNVPAGSYKVGARYSAGPTFPSGYSSTYRLQNSLIGTAISTSTTQQIKDDLRVITLVSSGTIKIENITENNSQTELGIPNSITYINILRIT
jgi:hypothetical protein